MNPPTDPTSSDDHDMLAAEYALGVLDADAWSRARVLEQTSAEFAAQTALWQARLAPLADQIDPITPPDIFPRIEARLFGTPPARSTWAWWRGPWGIGAAALACAAAFAVFVQFLPLVNPPAPQMQATVLEAGGSDLRYLAQRFDGQIILTRTAGPAPAPSRSYELWVIDGPAAPVSAGLIDVVLIIPEPAAAPGYVLAITDEPLGGGPNGVATGEILALGHFSEN